MSITQNQIIEAVAGMSVMDIVKLITAMEEKFGVSSTTVAVANSVNTEITEEKTEFNVILKSVGTNKVAVIKAVRSITNLGLKEAKDLVESAPAILKESISKNNAEILKKNLEEVGAEVEVK